VLSALVVRTAAVLGEPTLTHGAYVHVSVRDHAPPNLRDDDDERDRPIPANRPHMLTIFGTLRGSP
jgi:hypothetical protein